MSKIAKNIKRRSSAALMLILTGLCSCHQSYQEDFSVMEGKFVQSARETGELEAIEASSIIMPRISNRYGYSFKIVGLVDHGSIVEKGDSVAALDPSSIYKYIIQRQEELENSKAKAEKQRVEAENNRRGLEVQLKNEKAAYDLKKLELERMQFETGPGKKVKELEFEQAGLKLDKVRRKLNLNPTLEKYDRRINELEIKQQLSDIQNAFETLQNMVLYSPGNGYFQVNYNRRTGQNYKLGDEVYIGSMIASIPDVSGMKAKSYVHENDISKVRPGMSVIIRLDALPDVKFEGILKKVSSICTEKDKEKIFTTEVSVIDKDERLKPGMSVSCEYMFYESDNEIFVPNACILSEGNKTYLFVRRGNKFRKTEVITGASNANHTVIKTKLKAGRELLPAEKNQDI